MIVYEGGGLGDFEVLTRIHGSAAYKAFPLAVISTGILYGYAFIDFAGQQTFLEKLNGFESVIIHPYPIGVFMSFFRYQTWNDIVVAMFPFLHFCSLDC